MNDLTPVLDSSRMNLKFVIVLWGERYIKDFTDVSLPTHLASGNLPYLAKETNLEIFIMTSDESRPFFENSQTFKKLRSFSEIKYFSIDDLIEGNYYGITLTLAFARAIKAVGLQQTKTCFVFMNSDFVLADGAMVTLIEKLRQGHRCIIAPSLRVRAEEVGPKLVDMVDPNNRHLEIAPRDLVHLAFDNLHPTVVAKTVTQNFVHCQTYNQIYWSVTPSTLLARYYLAFPLALCPEKPIGRVNSYVDYGFIPELIPSREFEVLGDSDEFCMIELQPTQCEKDFVRLGPASPDDITRDLSVWTTYEHRLCAEFDVVFRTSEAPDCLETFKTQAGNYVDELRRRMSRFAANHDDHPYWYYPLQNWFARRSIDDPGTSVVPIELAEYAEPFVPARDRTSIGRESITQASEGGANRLFLLLLKRLVGRMPNVTVLSRAYLNSRLVNWALAKLRREKGARMLLVCRNGSYLRDTFREELGGDVMDIDNVLSLDVDGRHYEHIFIQVHDGEVPTSAAVINRLETWIPTGGSVWVLIEHEGYEFGLSNFTSELSQRIEDIFPSAWNRFDIAAKFTGDRFDARVRNLRKKLEGYAPVLGLRRARRPRAFALLVAGLGARLALTSLMAINNLCLGKRMPSHEVPAFCSGALIVFSNAQPPRQQGSIPRLVGRPVPMPISRGSQQTVHL
ncbi:MAG: hypothetical protein ACTS3R_18895 [Inquilinaceae bacterium]